ncbi:hypothetical protein FO519_002092 [Halicephalobus sp. NKZ332]|nr:hypothetical protein FO519_002092 [Halicephalobus sp. NKZ332]
MGVLQDGRIIAASAAVGILAGCYVYKRYRDNQKYWNSEFVPAGVVKELYVHPIKSGKALNIGWIDCTKNGAKYNENKDRNFLIVDEKANHLFLTARQYPKLVLVESHVENNTLTVKIPDGRSVSVDLAEVIKKNDVRRGILHAKLTQDGLDCGDEVGELISEFIETTDKRKIRLLYYVKGLDTERDCDTDPSYWLNPVPLLHDTPAFQDLASYMLCTDASVDELNGRLSELDDDKCTVSVRNFRPNINVSGTLPFDEDRWLHVRIGEVEFACFKPCTRCVLTTVDPDAGKMNKNMQPLKTLRTYRLAPKGKLLDNYKESPIFGVNLAVIKEGRIKVGDEVLMGVLQDGRIIAASAAVGILAGYYVYKRYHDSQKYWNSEFVPVGIVKELYIYPIKSSKALNIGWIDCTKNGAKYNENKDRTFLIVDEKANHLFLTARQYPKLVLVESHVENNTLTVKIPDGRSVSVDLAEVIKKNDVRRGVLHDKFTQDGFDCGNDVGQLISELLETTDKRNVRLLYYVKGLDTERNFEPLPSFWLNPPAFQDLSTYMLCTDASVDELNGRLSELDDDKCAVSVRNFRPNINVSGTLPFDEDRWLHVRIGEVEFACFKPCTRCVLTTVDPDEGKVNKNMQPLRLLRTYRLAPKGKLLDRYKESPIFGVNLAVIKEGKVKVGDKVLVRYKPTPY